MEYVSVPEVEDYLLNSCSRDQVIRMLKSRNLEDRMDLCKKIRNLQRKLEEKVDGKKLLLDRWELDSAIYCGFLYEPYEIKSKRWEKMDIEGEMKNPDLVLFFEFYKKSGCNDKREELILKRREVYQEINEQLKKVYKQYCEKNKIELIVIPSSSNIREKYGRIKDIIGKNREKNKIVFTGGSHSGKTTIMRCIKKSL